MKPNCLVMGHRGAKAYIAENTLESIQKALDFNVDGIEIDVHCCATGELVVFHDFTLDRMTNGEGELAKQSLAELKKLKVDGQFSIPTLDEVLDLIDRQCILNIELKGKSTAEATCKTIQNYIKDYGWQYSDFLVSSFQHHEIEAVFNIDKNIPLGVLTKANMVEAIEFAEIVQAKAIHPGSAIVTRDNVKLAQSKGYDVNVWTVNDKATIIRMKDYGVNAIISDNPDLV
ncbi:glycerophosphoryl diester phosphodiesterase [Formosa agariphila KMM 3901]|uniref:Glycerophosphoryl diester phosphodiesterase n=1 Tax=Formosa agariphila (strain DSM 15362 / KCTC 12365 / LMG 23005 / KMM 3901 / M-2Alg 35-1) TaxID=1347342 RepID=T2KPR1_FORAG|nr:glycerophosphodiester phosphodiesterase family protein [Formosa agariphila]CDF80730.1 glycerophosphoryl diester phosphodiesterase [Formosa agariphila KMM 3901]